MPLTSSQVRSAFLEFFRGKGHEVVPSSPLVPANDPTLMFANAGMVQFKDVFTGKEKRATTRAASSQKCIRISGKHNDLENVGVTARHHTFFEMLGNFSFGDYFKEEAIAFAWELLTKTYAIPKEQLCITVFGGDREEPSLRPDDEARALWRKVTGFGDDRVLGMGMKDNFWQMGETGPCGPCTEIHFHNGGPADLSTFGQEPGEDGKGWMEIWNLVFMQFERSLDGGRAVLAPLPRPCVDTGAGLERVTSVLQGKVTNYDTDLLRALVDKAAAISGKRYGGTLAPDDVSMRVIADHARTTAFLVAEGIFPDRAGREYVLRRVMRRAIRHGHRLGVRRPFLHEVALECVRLMGDAYPELVTRRGVIASVTEDEEVRFRETIERGLDLLEKNKDWRDEGGRRTLPGPTAFKLYDTYGFPLDLTEVIGRERGFEVDVAGFETAMEEQRKRSEGSKLHDEAAVAHVWRDALAAVPGGAVRFTGYEREAGEGTVLALVKDAALAPRAAQGERVQLVVDETPFYAESGGQLGDAGVVTTAAGARLVVDDTQRPLPGLVVHAGVLEAGAIAVGDRVTLEVDHGRRAATRRNHSATHLLHYALRRVLGEQATQKGSLVGPDRLRFDFAHGKPLSTEELARIEDLVNAKVLENAAVETAVMPIAEARAAGAVAMFGEKYGETVRVLTMTRDSVELCGGTHARALGDIGLFKILSETGVAAGVRRIEAATGWNALAYLRQLERTSAEASRAVGGPVGELAGRVEKLQADKKAVEKELAELKRKVALGGAGGGGGGLDDELKKARDVPGGKALAVKTDVADPATLRELAEKLRDRLGPSVVLVGSPAGGKASLVVAVAKGLTDRYKAGELVKRVAQVVGGSGGGRPDMAQAGGPAVDKLDEALDAFYAAVS